MERFLAFFLLIQFAAENFDDHDNNLFADDDHDFDAQQPTTSADAQQPTTSADAQQPTTSVDAQRPSTLKDAAKQNVVGRGATSEAASTVTVRKKIPKTPSIPKRIGTRTIEQVKQRMTTLCFWGIVN